ncbi:hypothetical protein VTI28DRAFT_8577 [Corynascus sepedonium]
MSGKTTQTLPNSPAYPNGGPDKAVPEAANLAPNTAGGSRDDKHPNQSPSSEPLEIKQARLPNDSTDPDNGVPEVNNPAPDPTSTNGGDNCPNQGLPSGPPIESPADEAADKSAKANNQELGGFSKIDVHQLPTGISITPDEFFSLVNRGVDRE